MEQPPSLRPRSSTSQPLHLLWIQGVLLWIPPSHFKLLPGDADVAVATTEGVAGPAGPAPHGRTHEQREALLTVAALEARDNVSEDWRIKGVGGTTVERS